ncbi:hypothetical protein HOLleu_04812 [Holothuria leucospilota]|uniref:Uncharacterized protein n=1 Tax=Holothuria leucospilota TaxID=206669 RepID=A0A9Q1CJ38_HOLLE|nr:hypothetical protein HOLleu_04812 [Holothuria leucospilota]
MGNVQSLRNKLDELAVNVRFLNAFRNISIMASTETWLMTSDPDEHVCIDGFKLVRGDRIPENVDKMRGNGLCVYTN